MCLLFNKVRPLLFFVNISITILWSIAYVITGPLAKSWCKQNDKRKRKSSILRRERTHPTTIRQETYNLHTLIEAPGKMYSYISSRTYSYHMNQIRFQIIYISLSLFRISFTFIVISFPSKCLQQVACISIRQHRSLCVSVCFHITHVIMFSLYVTEAFLSVTSCRAVLQ